MVTVNVAVSEPAGTVTPAGTVAPAWLLERLKTAPPTGAGPFSTIVATDWLPLTKLDGLSERLTTDSGLTVRVAVTEDVVIEAVRMAVVGRGTA